MGIDEEMHFKEEMGHVPDRDLLLTVAYRTKCIQEQCPQCQKDIQALQIARDSQAKEIKYLRNVRHQSTKRPSVVGAVTGFTTAVAIGLIEYFRPR